MSKAVFTKTLTLSLRERGQQADGSLFSEAHLANTALSFAKRLKTILPLPEGEGRSEGERDD